MKSRVIIFLLLASVVSVALFPVQSQSTMPVILHHESGEKDLFRIERIDSITYSCYDLDSILHPHIVAQTVWMKGIPKRSLIAEIDSMSFKVPQVKPKTDSKCIGRALYEYSIGVENDSIILIDKAIPRNILPTTGDMLYHLEMDSKFPGGFLGRVISVDERIGDIAITCTLASYADVFDSFYGSFHSELQAQEVQEFGKDSGEVGVASLKAPAKVPGFSFSIPIGEYFEPLEGTSISFGGEITEKKFDVKTTPGFEIETDVLVTEDGREYRANKVTGTLKTTVNYALVGNAEFGIEKELIKQVVPVAPAINAYMSLGVGIQVAAEEMVLKGEISKEFGFYGYYSLSTGGDESNGFTPEMRLLPSAESHTDMLGTGKVEITAGPALEIGFESVLETVRRNSNKPSDKNRKQFSMGRVCFRLQGGLKAAVNACFSEEDWERSSENTNLYKALSKDDNLTLGFFADYGFEASLGFANWSYMFPRLTPPPFLKSPILQPVKKTESLETLTDKLTLWVEYGNGLICGGKGLVTKDIADIANPIDIETLESLDSKESKNHFFDALYPSPGSTFRYYPYQTAFGRTILCEPWAEYTEKDRNLQPVYVDNYIEISNHGQAKNPHIIVKMRCENWASLKNEYHEPTLQLQYEWGGNGQIYYGNYIYPISSEFEDDDCIFYYDLYVGGAVYTGTAVDGSVNFSTDVRVKFIGKYCPDMYYDKVLERTFTPRMDVSNLNFEPIKRDEELIWDGDCCAYAEEYRYNVEYNVIVKDVIGYYLQTDFSGWETVLGNNGYNPNGFKWSSESDGCYRDGPYHVELKFLQLSGHEYDFQERYEYLGIQYAGTGTSSYDQLRYYDRWLSRCRYTINGRYNNFKPDRPKYPCILVDYSYLDYDYYTWEYGKYKFFSRNEMWFQIDNISIIDSH